jgi:hypothetical protein
MTSFPYLKISRDFGVPYGDVIRLVETFGRRLSSADISSHERQQPWAAAACIAWVNELRRRADLAPLPLMEESLL